MEDDFKMSLNEIFWIDNSDKLPHEISDAVNRQHDLFFEKQDILKNKGYNIPFDCSRDDYIALLDLGIKRQGWKISRYLDQKFGVEE